MTAAWWRDTWLIARREIEERSRARSFRITTAIMILAVAAAVVIPAIVSHHHKIEKVGLLGASDPALRQAAIAAGRVTGNRVQVVAVASLDAARAELRSGALAAVIIDGRELLIKQQPVSGTSSSTATFSGALAELVGVAQRLPRRRVVVGAHERDRDSDPGRRAGTEEPCEQVHWPRGGPLDLLRDLLLWDGDHAVGGRGEDEPRGRGAARDRATDATADRKGDRLRRARVRPNARWPA